MRGGIKPDFFESAEGFLHNEKHILTTNTSLALVPIDAT
jgi:hypothetical protein